MAERFMKEAEGIIRGMMRMSERDFQDRYNCDSQFRCGCKTISSLITYVKREEETPHAAMERARREASFARALDSCKRIENRLPDLGSVRENPEHSGS